MNPQVWLKYPFVFLLGLLCTYACSRGLGRLRTPLSGRSAAPGAGAPAIFVGFAAACTAIFLLPWLPFSGQLDLGWWVRLIPVAVVAMAGGGLLDWRALGMRWRLALMGGVGLLAWALGLRVFNLFGAALPPALDAVLTMLWFGAFQVAFSLPARLPGLAAGLAGLASAGLAGGFLLRHMTADTLVVTALAGVCFGYLACDWRGLTSGLGNAGAMLLGVILAAIAAGASAKAQAVIVMGVPLLAVGIHSFDALIALWFVATRRITWEEARRLLGEGVGSHDGRRFEQRLLRTWRTERRASLWLYALSAGVIAAGLAVMFVRSTALGLYILSFAVLSLVGTRHFASAAGFDQEVTVLDGLRRPPYRVLAVILYPLVDLLFLGVALGVTLLVDYAPPSVPDWQKQWVRSWPLWVGAPFIGLWLVGAYRRVWSRARISEYALAICGLTGGVLVAAGASTWQSPEAAVRIFYEALHTLGLAIPLVAGVRMLPRVCDDLRVWRQRNAAAAQADAYRVLVYGAGERGIGFLRNGFIEKQGVRVPHCVVGLLDDDSNLHRRVVHGFHVLGDVDHLAHAIRHALADAIVIAADLAPDVRAALLAAARTDTVDVWEWQTRPVAVPILPSTTG